MRHNLVVKEWRNWYEMKMNKANLCMTAAVWQVWNRNQGWTYTAEQTQTEMPFLLIIPSISSVVENSSVCMAGKEHPEWTWFSWH